MGFISLAEPLTHEEGEETRSTRIKTPDDELQEMSHTQARKFKPHPRHEPAFYHQCQAWKANVPLLHHASPKVPSQESASVSVSAQDGIVALGKAHARSAPSLSSLPKVALETVPAFAWLNTDRSRPWRVECRPLSFLRSSFLQTINAVTLWL